MLQQPFSENISLLNSSPQKLPSDVTSVNLPSISVNLSALYTVSNSNAKYLLIHILNSLNMAILVHSSVKSILPKKFLKSFIVSITVLGPILKYSFPLIERNLSFIPSSPVSA